MGDTASGKTSIIVKYIHNIFTENYISTSCTKLYKHGEYLNIHEYIDVRDHAINCKNVHGVMIVYDIHNQESYHNINNWINECYRYYPSHIPIIVCGTKSDLSGGEIYKYENEEGDKMKTFIVSAKTGKSINDAFTFLLDQINKQYIVARIKQHEEDTDKNKKWCVLM